MIKVAATYVISGFPHRIYSSDAKWGRITMAFMGEKDAELRVTDEVDDSISEKRYFTDLLVELEEIKRGFEFELQCKLTLGKKSQQFGEKQNYASSALAIGNFSVGFLSPRNPPHIPPKVKREHDRLIMVFVEASSFHDYQDEEYQAILHDNRRARKSFRRTAPRAKFYFTRHPNLQKFSRVYRQQTSLLNIQL